MLRLMLIRVCGKLKIKFTRNASFFRDGLSSWSFGSRQNSQCHGLDKTFFNSNLNLLTYLRTPTLPYGPGFKNQLMCAVVTAKSIRYPFLRIVLRRNQNSKLDKSAQWWLYLIPTWYFSDLLARLKFGACRTCLHTIPYHQTNPCSSCLVLSSPADCREKCACVTPHAVSLVSLHPHAVCLVSLHRQSVSWRRRGWVCVERPNDSKLPIHFSWSGDDGDEGGGGDRPQRMAKDGLQMVCEGGEGGRRGGYLINRK